MRFAIHNQYQSVNKVSEPAPITSSLSKKPNQKQQKTTTIETLNAPTSTSTLDDETVANDADDEDEDSSLPKMTPELLEFSKIKRGNFEESYRYIQAHRPVYVEGADDALLVAAFDAETRGESAYALNCVNQALLIQYCQKLGADGPALFFKR
jgi:cell division cycle protein 37